MSKKNKLSELENIIKKLRSDTGCPWDRELDFESLKTLTLEETYELIDALEKNDDDLILDELSDLLVHILFYSEIANSSNLFNFDDILDHAKKKLIKRHPHVFDKENFGNLKTPEEVEKNWTKLKGENTNPKKSFLDEFNFFSHSSVLLKRLIKKLLSLNIHINKKEVPKTILDFEDIPNKLFKLYFYLIQNNIDPEIELRKKINSIKQKIINYENNSNKKFKDLEDEIIYNLLFVDRYENKGEPR